MEQRPIAGGVVRHEGGAERPNAAWRWNPHAPTDAPRASWWARTAVDLMIVGLVLFFFLCLFTAPILRLVKTVAGALRGKRDVPLVHPAVLVPGIAGISGTRPAQTGSPAAKIRRVG
jgi:hypothetical protein